MAFKILLLNVLLGIIFVDYTLCMNVVNTISDKKVITMDPIVIQTHEHSYDYPNLQDYRVCYENRQKCQDSCQNRGDPLDCKKCPICPVLMESDIVIQGFNDTNIQSLKTATLNATNVIRLTNDIRNVIHNNMGSINTHSDNNIQLNQNISASTGGKYGLGKSESGSCCWIIRQRKCQSMSINCILRKKKECGDRCVARVMYAKRVRRCYSNGKCKHTFIYEPHRKRSVAKCRHIHNWPYLYCGAQLMVQCQQCLRLPYFYILMNGMPDNCLNCFSKFLLGPITQNYWNFPAFGVPRMSSSTIPLLNSDNVEFGDAFLHGSGWNLEKKQFRDGKSSSKSGAYEDAYNIFKSPQRNREFHEVAYDNDIDDYYYESHE